MTLVLTGTIDEISPDVGETISGDEVETSIIIVDSGVDSTVDTNINNDSEVVPVSDGNILVDNVVKGLVLTCEVVVVGVSFTSEDVAVVGIVSS